MARNLLDCEDGFLRNATHLIHDRDPVFTKAWRDLLKSEGIKCVRIPAKSPNCNPHAERFVKTVRDECLRHFVISVSGTSATFFENLSPTTIPRGSIKGSVASLSVHEQQRATTMERVFRSSVGHGLVDCSTTTIVRPREASPGVCGQDGVSR
jgi:hypothetical protein